MSIREKLALRKRRLRLSRVQPSFQSPAPAEDPLSQPVCRLQIAPSGQACPDKEPDDMHMNCTGFDDLLKDARQSFPEELHLPLLFNDERNCEERRHYAEQSHNRRPSSAFAADANDDLQLYGVYMDPRAFLRSQRQITQAPPRSSQPRNLSLLNPESTSSSSPCASFESEISFEDDGNELLFH